MPRKEQKEGTNFIISEEYRPIMAQLNAMEEILIQKRKRFSLSAYQRMISLLEVIKFQIITKGWSIEKVKERFDKWKKKVIDKINEESI